MSSMSEANNMYVSTQDRNLHGFNLNLSNFPDTDALPDDMKPIANDEPWLEYTPARLAALRDEKYDRIGAAVFAYDYGYADNTLSVLVELLNPSEKNPKPVWTVPSETAQFYIDEGGSVKVENSMQTAMRCLVEETGLNNRLVMTPKKVPWIHTAWVIGSALGEERKIFAPIHAIRIPTLKKLANNMSSDDGEVAEYRVIEFEDALQLQQKDRRNGFMEAIAQGWINGFIVHLTTRMKKPPFLDDINLRRTLFDEDGIIADYRNIAEVIATREPESGEKPNWQDAILKNMSTQNG